jgi:hexosaminidase
MGFSGTRVFALLLAAGLLPVALSGCGKDEPVDTDTPTAERLSLIPAPASVQRSDGEFIVDAATPLLARGEAARTVAAQFAGFVSKARGIDLKISDAADDDASGIVFAIDAGMTAGSPEAYTLEVTPNGSR